jgi:sugar/nucleoside kinase (ribokinase family)
MRAANDLGITVVYGPGGIFSDLGVKQLGRMLSAAEYVILSRRELGILTKRTRENEGVLSLLEAGAKRLVVTLGRDGAALFEASGNRNGDEMGFIKQSQEGFEATAVDTTGAGDAFTAGFVRGLAGGMNLMECLIIGNACGSLAIAKMGPREAMPSWKEVSEFIHFHQERAGDHDS